MIETNVQTSPGADEHKTVRQADFWTRKTNLPTYEVVGRCEPIDGRDTINARARLKPGTEKYRIYYGLRPEWEEADKKLRPFDTAEQKAKQKASLFGKEPFVLALNDICRIDENLSRDAEGPIREHQVKMTPEEAARNIKGVARYLGADLVGISRINAAWVYTHNAHEEDGLKWGDPIQLDHPYAISMVMAHRNFDMLLAARGLTLVSTIETNHTVFGVGAIVGLRLSSYIRNLGYAAKFHGFGGQVQSIPLAVDAGLGELGRSGMLVTKQFGPAVRIVTVTTDLPLAVDSPVDIGVQDLCVKCKKCSEACPVGAMSNKDEKEVRNGVKIWPVDGARCFRLKAAQGGDWTCLYCMSACCWTKPQNLFHRSCGELAARSALARTVLAWLDDALYGHQPRQHRLPPWLSLNHDKPGARERISDFLYHI